MPVSCDPAYPPRPCLRNRARAAFSLVELSVVIVIISMVAVMGLEVTATMMSRTAYQSTAEKLAVIDKAIVDYRRTYGRLPCPSLASNVITNTCYGKGAYSPNCNTIGTCAATAVTLATDLVFGDVPARDLNLPLSYMVDGYGQKLRYVVSSRLTVAGTAASQFAHVSSVDAIVVRSGKQDASCGGASNRCQIRGTMGALGSAAYFLFSTGSDRRGSMSPGGVQTSCLLVPTTSYDGRIDTVNCRLNSSPALAFAVPKNAFYDSRYNIGTQEETYFDDIVIWRAKKDL